MKLCDRGRKGFRLTDKGKAVYAATHKLFASLSEFQKTIDDTRYKLVGNLRIAAIDNWVFDDVGPVHRALSKFMELAPDVNLELHSVPPDEIELLTQSDQVSIGVGVFHKRKPGLSYETIGRETVGLYCSKDHPLFDAVSPEAVNAALEKAKFCKRAYLDETTVAPISSSLKSNACAHQVESVAFLILSGNHIGYLPESFATYWVDQGRLRCVGEGMYNLETDIDIVSRRGRTLNFVEQTFVDFLKDRID